MADPKGDKLFVNLGASQTRRRLKGFGHGVRKVQTAGRNQAVIIHTALGRNLAELEAKFADVGFSRAASDLGEPVENLKNVGPQAAAWLRDVGISAVADLERTGPVAAYRLVKQVHPQATLNLLWALAGGLADLDWRELPEAVRKRLREELG
jgi:DNA transformation protein